MTTTASDWRKMDSERLAYAAVGLDAAAHLSDDEQFRKSAGQQIEQIAGELGRRDEAVKRLVEAAKEYMAVEVMAWENRPDDEQFTQAELVAFAKIETRQDAALSALRAALEPSKE